LRNLSLNNSLGEAIALLSRSAQARVQFIEECGETLV